MIVRFQKCYNIFTFVACFEKQSRELLDRQVLRLYLIYRTTLAYGSLYCRFVLVIKHCVFQQKRVLNILITIVAFPIKYSKTPLVTHEQSVLKITKQKFYLKMSYVSSGTIHVKVKGCLQVSLLSAQSIWCCWKRSIRLDNDLKQIITDK